MVQIVLNGLYLSVIILFITKLCRTNKTKKNCQGAKKRKKREDNDTGKARIDREERDGQTCLQVGCSSLTVWAERPVLAIAVLPAGSEQFRVQVLSKRNPLVQL